MRPCLPAMSRTFSKSLARGVLRLAVPGRRTSSCTGVARTVTTRARVLPARFRQTVGAWAVLFLLATVLYGPFLWAGPAETRPLAAIVTSSASEAYLEAIEGLRSELAAGRIGVFVVDLSRLSGPAELRQEIARRRPDLLVTIGNSAAETVAAETSIPFIVTMILRSKCAVTADEGRQSPLLVGSVSLDLSSEAIVGEIRRLFPDKQFLGVIQGRSSRLVDSAELQAAARKYGFSLKTAFCDGPEDLMDEFAALREFTDIVWTPPEFSLFNSATVKPLVLASLRHRIAIVGFSSGFVRAGAAAGMYPHFFGVGRQTGRLARKYLSDRQPQGHHGPESVRIAINERMLRLLGIRAEIPKNEGDRLELVR